MISLERQDGGPVPGWGSVGSNR